MKRLNMTRELGIKQRLTALMVLNQMIGEKASMAISKAKITTIDINTNSSLFIGNVFNPMSLFIRQDKIRTVPIGREVDLKVVASRIGFPIWIKNYGMDLTLSFKDRMHEEVSEGGVIGEITKGVDCTTISRQ